MSGGGTAGHVYPALAVASHFSDAHDEVSFVGTPGGLEARLVPEAGISFRGLDAAGFDRGRPWTLITSSVRLAISTFTASRWLASVRPDVVVGFGGYVSIPVGVAAALRGIPLVLHEQNSVPGMANKFLSRWAVRVGVTYEESARWFRHPQRVELTGNPVRPAVLGANRSAAREVLGVAEDRVVLLAFGGSQGARHLNSALVGIRDQLLALPNVEVFHVAGPRDAQRMRDAVNVAGGDGGGRWRVIDYMDDMGSALAASDLVLARAGATSIAEITALGLPAVLVPYPYATDDHQTKNASAMVEHGAAERIADSELDGERLGDVLAELLGDPARRASMAAASKALGRPEAADHVARLAREAVAGAPHSDDENTKESPVA
jgi:UDP-N-acetylglucosamine--N-acetylmuramyl-(pentapeptide) pyrophosphoryl-undecaprenol N-acetylglucosamine transferase